MMLWLMDYFKEGVETPELVLLGKKKVLFSVTSGLGFFCYFSGLNMGYDVYW